MILAPKEAGLITYRLLHAFSGLVTNAETSDFFVQLINTGLAEQFIIHMKAVIGVGFLCASPYVLYQLFRFVSPALYVNDRRYIVRVVGLVILCSCWGACQLLPNFSFDFPFLGNCQVSGEAANMITF